MMTALLRILLTPATALALSGGRAAPDARELSLLTELQRTLETDRAATAANERAAVEAAVLERTTQRASNAIEPVDD